MLMMIQYESGLRLEAILLAAGAGRMRLMARSQTDTLELTNLDGCWRTGQGDAIEIDALIPIPGANLTRLSAEIHPRTHTAASI